MFTDAEIATLHHVEELLQKYQEFSATFNPHKKEEMDKFNRLYKRASPHAISEIILNDRGWGLSVFEGKLFYRRRASLTFSEAFEELFKVSYDFSFIEDMATDGYKNVNLTKSQHNIFYSSRDFESTQDFKLCERQGYYWSFRKERYKHSFDDKRVVRASGLVKVMRMAKEVLG